MSKIAIPDLVEKLGGDAAKPLKNYTKTGLLDYAKGADTTAQSGPVKLVFGASIAAAIEVFNGADDIDEDGVIGSREAAADGKKDTTDWRPQLPFENGSAWLKYSLAASASAKASAKIGTAGGSIAGDRSLRLLCYKRHDAARRIGEAVLSDVDELGSVLSAGDIAALSLGEAVALKARGKLTATFSVSWADIFSTSLQALSSLPGAASGAYLIEIGTGASATFTATLEDDFTLCFVREKASGERAFRVAVRKSEVHDTRFQAKAGVDIKFADPAAVKTALASVMAGVLDAPAAAIKAIEDATSLDKVPAKYRPVVEALAKRYGLEGSPLQPLKKKLAELSEQVTQRINQIAETKVSLGLTYEYLRLSSEASLLEARLSQEALTALHGALLNFDFARVLAYQGSGLALDFFLHQKTVERVRAWGFSLGMGTWFNLKSTQTRKDRFVSRRYVSPEGERWTRAYLGSTQYTTTVNTVDFGASFKADLEEARAAQLTTPANFKCGLQLWWQERRANTAADLDRIADDAVLWGVIPAADAPALAAQLRTALQAAATCQPRFNMMLSDRGATEAMRSLALADTALWCKHSARALPQVDKFPARATAASRELIYQPFFEAYRHRPDAMGQSLQQLIESSLRKYDRALADRERADGVSTLYRLLLQSSLQDRRFWRRWGDMRSAAARMRELLEVRGDWLDFDENFRDMRAMFEQTFLIRAIASLLAQELAPALKDNKAFAATLAITYRSGDQDKTLVVGGSG